MGNLIEGENPPEQPWYNRETEAKHKERNKDNSKKHIGKSCELFMCYGGNHDTAERGVMGSNMLLITRKSE